MVAKEPVWVTETLQAITLTSVHQYWVFTVANIFSTCLLSQTKGRESRGDHETPHEDSGLHPQRPAVTAVTMEKGEVEQVSLTLKQNTQNPGGIGVLRETDISAAIGQQLNPAPTNWILSNPQENK